MESSPAITVVVLEVAIEPSVMDSRSVMTVDMKSYHIDYVQRSASR